MREIKFRAWDEENKELLPPQDLSQGRVYWPWLGLKDVLLTQFTGLHDKNGKEIYEGDICKYAWRADIGGDITDEGIAEVFYMGAAFSVNHLLLNHISHAEIEVIGNIYENPDLLNQK